MASKKWMEYQNMTTRAKHFGGANNYQAFLVMAGSLGGAALLKGGEFIFNKFKSIRNGKIEDELSKVTYEVTNLSEELSDEFGDAKNIKVGTNLKARKLFEIEGEKSLFIEIVGEDNNPYLLREKIVEKISNYKLSENMD